MKRLLPFLAVLATLIPGCGMVRDEPISKDADKTIQDAEFKSKESRTLSNLATLETSLKAYIEAEKKIPQNLDALIPQYLADIPGVELGVSRHRDNSTVYNYPPSILRDGAIDGSRLRDTGRWGYVHNERQVVIFVDCTHKMSGGTLWYQARGVY